MMKKAAVYICMMLGCIMGAVSPAFANGFQLRMDVLAERNYYNPAANYLGEGTYLKGFAGYDFNLPALAGKNPLDVSVDFTKLWGNHAVFAAVNAGGGSYWYSHSVAGGYNYNFRNIAGSEHSLSIGTRFWFSFNEVNMNSLPYGDEGMRMLVHPDFDLGIDYNYRALHLGFSIRNIVNRAAKYEGLQYVVFPRAYYLNASFDISLLQDKLLVQPYGLIGVNQNVVFVIGADLTAFGFARLGYAFRAPDLSHCINLAFTISKRVCLHAGYSVTPAHKYSTLNTTLTVKIGK